MSEFERYTAVTDGMATIINVISYSNHLEDLYLEQPSSVIVELREALIEMYRKVLKFLSKAIPFYDEGGFSTQKAYLFLQCRFELCLQSF
jgi:hypothetical protein